MAQPPVADSKLADSSDNPQIGERGASVTAAAAATYAAPAVTAANPTAPTAYSAHASGGTTVTSNAATDLDTTAAALATLVTEVTAYEVDISQIIVDNAATLVELDDLADDVALIRTALNDFIGRLEAHGLIADN